jgi:hypothetical protein
MNKEEIRSLIGDRFLDIVISITEPSPDKMRFVLKDKSFVDVRISQKVKRRFDFHWARCC